MYHTGFINTSLFYHSDKFGILKFYIRLSFVYRFAKILIVFRIVFGLILY